MPRRTPTITALFVTAPLATALLVLSATSLPAETWTVTYDPNDPEDRIGRVVEQAASYDIVLVEAGTYYEHIPLEGKSITLKSLAGPEETILDGSVPFDGREDGIIYKVGEIPARLDVEGFTFRGGGGSRAYFVEKAGGAISWWTNGLSGARFRATNCRFLFNSVFESGTDNYGGAIFIHDVGNTEITSCVFQGNIAGVGADLCMLGHGEHTISDCDIVGGEGIAIYAGGPLTLTIEGNRFLRGEEEDVYWLLLDSQRTHIRNNVFENPWLKFDRFAFPGARYTLEFENNLLWNNPDPPVPGERRVRASLGESTVDFSNNTFVGVSLLVGGGSVSYCHNIFYRSPLLFDYGHVDFCCNNSWPETTAMPPGEDSCGGNISEDPEFCDEASGDFRISFDSPCAPENSPPCCGLIGALEPACMTQVETATWGRLKLRFYEED